MVIEILKYFHNKALKRLNKNTIKGLKNNFGDWCKGSNAILEIISAYFVDIFTSSLSLAVDMNMVLDCISLRVTNNMNDNYFNHSLQIRYKKLSLTCILLKLQVRIECWLFFFFKTFGVLLIPELLGLLF